MTSERGMKDGVESAAVLPETLINVLERCVSKPHRVICLR